MMKKTMPVKARRTSMQYAINWMREIAICKNGAMPGLYSGFVALMRASIASLIEAKQDVPVMFSDLDLLKSWADKEGFKLESVNELPADEILRLRPTTSPKEKLTAVELYWVKANSDHYRTAMIGWCQKQYGKCHVLRAHRESIAFFRAIRDDLAKLPANHHVFGRSSQAVVLASINDSITKQKTALRFGGNKKIAYQLLAMLDADHVINRASLKKIPNAWVLLFPVPADANRGFGRIIERFRTPVSPDTKSINLAPEVAFKLFCGAMPRNRHQLNSLKKFVEGQIQSRDYVAAMVSSIDRKLPPVI